MYKFAKKRGERGQRRASLLGVSGSVGEIRKSKKNNRCLQQIRLKIATEQGTQTNQGLRDENDQVLRLLLDYY